MTRPWRYQSTQDKLHIFVSSRIQECKEERSVVQAVIRSLNHQPVLFEHLGARPYPPRDLYLSRLRDSQVMVAIYRSGYGYIDHANGMTMSGLEDEYRFAKQEDIDTLFYIWRSADGREPRLQSLIDEISNGPTIAYYEIPEQLHQRVRDDLTALITDKILSTPSHSGVIQEDSKAVLTHTLNSVGVVVRRDDLIRLLVERLKESSILCIYGAAGIGKTTFAAQLAQALGGKFVRASGLAPKEVFAVCADVLKGHPASEVTPFSTLDGARLAMAAAWAEIQSVTLILDECDYVSELLDAVSAGGGITASKRVVYTSRESSVAHQSFEVPPLTHAEIGQIVANSPWQRRKVSKSFDEGNPLVLQHALMRAGATFPAGMLNIESAGEILTYLALSPIPLTAEQLITLRADDSYSIGALIFDIDKLGPIVDDSPRGYRLMHSETAASIANQISKSPQRYRFFVNRLIRLTESSGHYRHAYELATGLGDGSARKYVTRAIREAARLGDWRLGVALTNQMLSEALDAESKSEAFHLMLSLVYPLELMGDAERAGEILKRAKPLAAQLGEDALISLEEVEISSRARRAMLSSDVEGLQNIYRRYAEQGKNWDQARVGLELSAIFLAAKNYEAAVEILHSTLSTFEELGDDYAIDLTQRNLASALSAIPGKEAEAERLIALITERVGDELDSRRQRAWLCNVLTRRLRTAGRHEEAEAMAKEAVDIATELGDESLRAVNLINLGNAYRGRKQPLEAIAAYEAAAISSQKSGRLDVQGEASRLVAGIYNDFVETGESRGRRQKAKFYAQHAVGLIRGTVNYEALANASWELGEALEALGEIDQAANALFEAAAAFRMASDPDAFSRALTYAANLTLSDHVEIYLRGISDTLGIEQPDPQKGLADQFLGLVAPIMETAPKGGLIHLLGSHLGEVSSHSSTPMKRGLASAVVERFRDFAQGTRGQAEPWRILYSAIAIAALLKDTTQPYLHHRLAASITNGVRDVFVREEGDGARVWTLVINIGRRITVTIACLDTTPASNLAGFALAMFIKAFEEDLAKDLIGSEASLDELLIQIGTFNEMPDDLRQMASQTLGIDKILADQSVTVSRPTDFKENSPTFVFLGSSFLSDISMGGVGGSNSLQLLFGLTLIELTYQLLRGEVDIDTIRPKVVSLVRRAHP